MFSHPHEADELRTLTRGWKKALKKSIRGSKKT